MCQFDFTYISPDKCEENDCSDTVVTDCWCGTKVVKNNEFCYAGNPVPKCGTTDSECMCDMGDGYEWAPKGTKCFGNKIIQECDLLTVQMFRLNHVWTQEYKCKYGAKTAVCTDAFHCEPSHFEPGGRLLQCRVLFAC